VPVSCYRIEAELRHDVVFAAVPDTAWVGVTFTGQHVPSPDGVHHVVGNVAFNDWKPARVPVGDRVETKGVARIQLFWFLNQPADGKFLYNLFAHRPKNDCAYFPHFEGPPKQRPWRTLALNVSPDAFCGFWGADPAMTMGPLSGADVPGFTEHLQESWPVTRGVALRPLEQRWVGVMVYGAKCTVRRLRVIPLSPADQP
jgi:hypothetical protein